MKITQAQIEAAAEILNVSYQNKAYSMKIAKEALTAAAAQVGECKTCGGLGYLVGDAEWEPYAVQCPDCKAAAQVGEPKIDAVQSEINKAYRLGMAFMKERCAQVAETYDMDGGLKDGLPKGWEGCRRKIAAAIRKLKVNSVDLNIIHPGSDHPGPFPQEEP